MNRPGTQSRKARLLCTAVLTAMALATAAGCGGGEPFSLVPVSGTVKYKDGTPIPAAKILVYFNPQVEAVDAKTHPKQGCAEVNVADGTFAFVTTHKTGDGATAGPNKVLVLAYDERENQLPAVPEKYGNPETTPFTIDVGSGSRELNLEIEKP